MEYYDKLKFTKVDYGLLQDSIHETSKKRAITCLYHSKNKQTIVQNKDVHEIILVKDANGYAMFWRYFWLENGELRLYTGEHVLGEEEEIHLLRLQPFVLGDVCIIPTRLDDEKYLLELRHPDS